MRPTAFCFIIRRLFNQERFDVNFALECFGRHERVVITATCRGCGTGVSRPEIPTDYGDHVDQYCWGIVRMMESRLRDLCECWQHVGRGTVFLEGSLVEPFLFETMPKKKVKQKQVFRRKIR